MLRKRQMVGLLVGCLIVALLLGFSWLLPSSPRANAPVYVQALEDATVTPAGSTPAANGRLEAAVAQFIEALVLEAYRYRDYEKLQRLETLSRNSQQRLLQAEFERARDAQSQLEQDLEALDQETQATDREAREWQQFLQTRKPSPLQFVQAHTPRRRVANREILTRYRQ